MCAWGGLWTKKNTPRSYLRCILEPELGQTQPPQQPRTARPLVITRPCFASPGVAADRRRGHGGGGAGTRGALSLALAFRAVRFSLKGRREEGRALPESSPWRVPTARRPRHTRGGAGAALLSRCLLQLPALVMMHPGEAALRPAPYELRHAPRACGRRSTSRPPPCPRTAVVRRMAHPTTDAPPPKAPAYEHHSSPSASVAISSRHAPPLPPLRTRARMRRTPAKLRSIDRYRSIDRPHTKKGAAVTRSRPRRQSPSAPRYREMIPPSRTRLRARP